MKDNFEMFGFANRADLQPNAVSLSNPKDARSQQRHPDHRPSEVRGSVGSASRVVSTRRQRCSAAGLALVVSATITTSGCATVISQDEVGVRDTFGNLSETTSGAGLKLFFWPVWDITKVSVRTVNLEVRASLPSQEGLTIESDVSILYRVIPDLAPKVLADVGLEYEQGLILPVFRSAIADVTAQYIAKDMHTGKRSEIEAAVRTRMSDLLRDRGFEIEAVLLKSIRLPDRLSTSIEQRLQAEQDAKRMLFVLEQERREAKRKVIEAEGVRDAQKTLADGLTPEVLKFQAIQALEELYKSENAKVIITDGSPGILLPQTP